MFEKTYKVIIIYDCGVKRISYLKGTKSKIKKDLEYFKSKADWYEEFKDVLVMTTNQPV